MRVIIGRTGLIAFYRFRCKKIAQSLTEDGAKRLSARHMSDDDPWVVARKEVSKKRQRKEEEDDGDDNELPWVRARRLGLDALPKNLRDAAKRAIALKQRGQFFVCHRKHIRLCVDPKTGVHYRRIDDAELARACVALSQSLVAVKTHRSAHGFLKIGEREYPGFGNYMRLITGGGSFKADRQQQYSSVIPACCLQNVLYHWPALRTILTAVCDTVLHVQMSSVKHIHLLVQAHATVHFDWHSDAFDMHLSAHSVTVTISLNEAPSAMSLWGFDPVSYDGKSIVAFPAAVLHRSVPIKSASGMCLQKDIMHADESELAAAPHKLVIFFDADS